MMKFTLGMAIIAFTMIVGSYQFLENDQLIAAREFGLKEAIARRDEMRQLKQKVEGIKKLGMVEGKDQKFNIERMLKIGSPGLEFSFTGQGRAPNSQEAIYKHTFKIEGPADFASTLSILRDLSTQPGFVVNRICYGCIKNRAELPKSTVLIQIEGFLYVYNPNLIS
jgi:hypothetical protein